jgi:hypothetical protein
MTFDNAQPRHFQRPAIIEMARYWTANYGDADHPLTVVHRHAKFPTLRWLVMAVILANELARFVPFNWL